LSRYAIRPAPTRMLNMPASRRPADPER
jgi:hypothetical protein